MLGFSREAEPVIHTDTQRGEREGFSLRNWLTQLLRLANLKFVGRSGRLEIQVRVNAAVMSLNSARQGFHVAVLRMPSLGNLNLSPCS